jgi:hypothetical protein
MKIVMYGAPLGEGGALTEIPFLLNKRIERTYKDASELQDLEADIAIANFTRDPVNSGNETGWNYLRLPKVKVQLAIQAEHYSEYIPEWVPGITENFDGSICYRFNSPFWDCDETIEKCFAKSRWDELGIPRKPVFYFDPLTKWNKFYTRPIEEFADYGFCIGSATVHRDRIIHSNPGKFKYIFGDMRHPVIQGYLKYSGIGFNIHKFDIRGKHPETDDKEVKNIAKTEEIKLALFYNLGMAVVTEKLDHTFPERFKDSIIEVDEMQDYEIDKNKLIEQTFNTEQVLNNYHDSDTELDNLINSIIKEFNL